jgi:hypothetical protein
MFLVFRLVLCPRKSGVEQCDLSGGKAEAEPTISKQASKMGRTTLNDIGDIFQMDESVSG